MAFVFFSSFLVKLEKTVGFLHKKSLEIGLVKKKKSLEIGFLVWHLIFFLVKLKKVLLFFFHIGLVSATNWIHKA